VTGEAVNAKKPAPDAYLLALARLQLPASQCLAFEDSRNGVEAAIAAGLNVVVCPSVYSAHETFPGALSVLADWSKFDWRSIATAQRRRTESMVACRSARPESESDERLRIHDERFDKLIIGHAKLERLWTGSRWRGPLRSYRPSGAVVHIPNNPFFVRRG